MGGTAFGKYRLIVELGHGGMADVFLAVQAGPAHSGFQKLTVVKRLQKNLAEDPEFIAMLIDEARIAARLNHPNVVQTNEVGSVDDQYFIAMEYLDGQPLHRIQHRAWEREKTDRSPCVTAALQYVVMMDTLAGLHHAHTLADFDGSPLGIVHRDMTPQNVFVTYDGQVKVVDFGIAKAAGRVSETRQGIIKGKVRYMAPEQATGQDVDLRADVFAVGVMLWEAATGRRLWKDRDELAIVHALMGKDIPSSPRAVDPSVPEEIDRICRRALAPHPDGRYGSAEEFRIELEQYLADAGLLVGAHRKLAAGVAELFEDKRAQIRGVIEKQLGVRDTPSGGLPGPFDSHSAASGVLVEAVSIVNVQAAPEPPTPPRTAIASPVRHQKRRAIVWGGALSLLVAMGVWMGVRSAPAESVAGATALSSGASSAPLSVVVATAQASTSATRSAEGAAATPEAAPTTTGAKSATVLVITSSRRPAQGAPTATVSRSETLPPPATAMPTPAPTPTRRGRSHALDPDDPWSTSHPSRDGGR